MSPSGSVAIGCGGNRRGGIGTEQQRVELGFERGEPCILDLQLLGFVLWPPADFVYSRAVSLLSRSDSCLDSIALICASIVGCQFNLANKRRQGGKEERNSDLLINRDAGMGGDVDMAVGGEEVIRTTKLPAIKAARPD